MSRKARTHAVFHDRETLEHAVRALTLEGVRRRRIHVYRASIGEGVVRTAPERGTAVSIGAGVGAAIGGALAIVSLVFTRDVLPLLDVVARLAGGAGTGALVGGLIGLLTGRYRPGAVHDVRGYRDFLLRVDTSDRASADRVRDLLTLAGGDPLPE